MATEKQIDLIVRLAGEFEIPADIDINNVAEMDTVEASKTIRRILKSKPLADSQTAKDREAIANITGGTYTLTAKQAAEVLNYKGEPYFGAEKVTVEVKPGGRWVNRVNPNHPIKDSKARRSILLLVAKKKPVKAGA